MDKTVTLIVDNHLFPCVYYIKSLLNYTIYKIESCESFQKTSFRNRYLVAGNNGVLSLTIPVRNGREQKTLITEVEIDNSQNWQRQHWKTILSCYRKAPFFDYYATNVEQLIFGPQPLLFQFNLDVLQYVLSVLKVSTSIQLTQDFLAYSQEENVADLRNKWTPKNYNMNPEEAVKYPQVFEDRHGFLPNLSILDLLFNQGPNARNLLESGKKES